MKTLQEKNTKRKSILIDVRSPREYLSAHIPRALNFPVLNDAQHCEIGTLYKSDSFEAKKRGSVYICENISKFLQNSEAFHPKNKLILYCARGGQRSKSLWLILREIGFDCERMEGGYKAYRQGVLNRFAQIPKQNFLTLYGFTGCGKSDLIAMSSSWSIDLEGLSKHYGSSFGDEANSFLGQPTQAMFENTLDCELQEKQGVVLIEGESKKMGQIVIPHLFFERMHQGVKILIKAPIEARVERIIKMYSQIKHCDFVFCMQKVRPYMQKNLFNEVMQSWERGDIARVALILLEKYYDRVYVQRSYDYEVDSSNIDEAYREILLLKERLFPTESKES